MRQGGGGRGQARGPAWLKACEADLGKLCHGVERGGGRLVQCLQGHRDQLSPTCKTAFDGRPGAARAATPPAPAPPAPAATAPPTPAAH
ncbi:MAG: cysteine rich repeat-containing protein [Candidatus Binatia bacterium]